MMRLNNIVTSALLLLLVGATNAIDILVPSESTSITKSDVSITFAASTNNAIQVVDGQLVDGTDLVQLVASTGTLRLSQTTGLTIVSGDPINGDSTIEFYGSTTANVNDELNGLSYEPPSGYAGLPTITVSIITNGSSQTVVSSSSFVKIWNLLSGSQMATISGRE